MSNNKEKINNKKTYIIFAVTIIICAMAGFFSVSIFSYINFMFEDVDTKALSNILNNTLPFVFVAIEFALFAVSAIIFSKAKRAATMWDGEDEDVIDQIESSLNIPLLLTNVGMVLAMLLFAVCAYVDKVSESEAVWPFLVTLISFVLSFVYIIGIQSKVVNLEKKLNPEKRGNVFDFKFSKQWEASMDEAEKQIQCMAGNIAFKAGSSACLVLWLVSLIGALIFDMGISSVVMVCIIWLVLVVTYVTQCMKLEKRK